MMMQQIKLAAAAEDILLFLDSEASCFFNFLFLLQNRNWWRK